MPTYEYACRGCGEHVEVVQSFRDDPLTECGLCGGTLRKVFSAAGIIFKGDGYYVTDTRKRDKAASTAATSSGDSAKGSSGDSASGSGDSGSGSGAGDSGSASGSGADGKGSGAGGKDSGAGGKDPGKLAESA